MNEKLVEPALRYGGIAVTLSVLLSMYLVMRNVEAYRINARSEQQLQQLTTRRQMIDGLLREFVAQAATDVMVLDILQKHQLVTTGPARK